ncbi:glycosyltransferase family 4 protein [Winogradskyella sp.]|uniref:glycosyltransferase family 4 protein n=1 Tax=Winogradskyella sp. TaxID=1883156 RepID=UPI001AFE339B|nr:glycosyltransferase family 4 protein [Winogradskyella sp.]MBO6881100.1 glycosyltransferase family 4 protein [Winogradskyella sp.]
MKLLHCLNSPHIGGIERLVIELAIEQKKQGVNVSIMLDKSDGQFFDYLKRQNIPVLYSGIKGGFDFNFSTYKKLKNRFNDFEIIHLHSFSPMRNIAAKFSKAKVVYTIHGLSKNVREENFLKYNIREFFKRFLLNKVDYFVANSNSTLKKSKKHYGLSHVKQSVIYNGIPIKEKNSKVNINLSDELIIGLVTRFTPRKRIDRLLVAFNLFLKKGLKGRLIMVGDGINFKEIQGNVKDMNLDTFTDMIGYITDVDQFYEKFHVVVQPSDNEGFGLVAVESYLHGLPIIVFEDSGGLKEVVELLEPEHVVKSEEELAQRLEFYYLNRQNIEKNSKNRINYAKLNYNVNRMAVDYQKVYDTMIKL